LAYAIYPKLVSKQREPLPVPLFPIVPWKKEGGLRHLPAKANRAGIFLNIAIPAGCFLGFS
jgi:hypothetical protein